MNPEIIATQIKALAETLPHLYKKQPRPPKPLIKSCYKLDQELYTVFVGDDGKCELATYIVRTIRGGYVYAIWKISSTWGNKAAIGKKFSKILNYGWLDPIPSWCRERCKAGDKFSCLHTTKRAAWSDPKNLRYLDDPEDAPIKKRVETAIKSALTRLKKG